MKLALRELRARPGRFVTATVILTLIAMLLMFLGGLLDGLIRNSTGAVNAQSADAIVYSETSQASFLRSRIDADTRHRGRRGARHRRDGRLGVVLLGARVPGGGPRDLADVALWGYEIAPAGVPEPPAAGEAYADEILQAEGVELGDSCCSARPGPRSPSSAWVERHGVQRPGRAVGEPRHLARRPRREPPRRGGLADDVQQALVVRGSGTPPTWSPRSTRARRPRCSRSRSTRRSTRSRASRSSATFNQILGVTVVIALVVSRCSSRCSRSSAPASTACSRRSAPGHAPSSLGLVTQAVVVTLIAAAVAGGLSWSSRPR
jgi:putative ABC transport system permease protein